MDTIVTHYCYNYKGQFCTDRRRSRAGRVEDSGGLGGRNRAVRSRRRPGLAKKQMAEVEFGAVKGRAVGAAKRACWRRI